jgi:tripartite-type tricarboxylate transporter receptor subunit TctC
LLPGFVSDNWFAMYFPAGTSREIVATMNAVIRKALATETVRAFAKREVLTLVGGTPDELGVFLKDEIARYGEVIRKGNITLQ